jgi:hypothetical protein
VLFFSGLVNCLDWPRIHNDSVVNDSPDSAPSTYGADHHQTPQGFFYSSFERDWPYLSSFFHLVLKKNEAALLLNHLTCVCILTMNRWQKHDSIMGSRIDLFCLVWHIIILTNIFLF